MADGDVKDLRSMLAEAATAADTPADTPVVETPEPQETPEAEAKPAGRARDEHGRFVAKDGESEEDAQAAGAAEEAAAATEATAEPEAVAPAAAPEAPAHWSQADKELVAKLPAEFRADVVNRFKAIEAGFTPKLQRLSQMEKDYGRANEIFAPHMDGIRARGQTPSDVIQIWAQVEEGLLMSRAAALQGRADPRGAQIAANIIRNYNIDPAEVAKYLVGGQPQQNSEAAGTGVSNGYVVDPVLAQEVQTIKQTMSDWQRQQEESKLSAAQTYIERFVQEKNPDGSLKHPFYSELEPVITELAQFEQSQKRPIDLSALYDRAVWQNESTRERTLSAQRQAAEKRAAEDRKAKAEAARKASSSVTGAPSPGQTTQRTPSTRSLRDQLLEAAAEADSPR